MWDVTSKCQSNRSKDREEFKSFSKHRNIYSGLRNICKLKWIQWDLWSLAISSVLYLCTLVASGGLTLLGAVQTLKENVISPIMQVFNITWSDSIISHQGLVLNARDSKFRVKKAAFLSAYSIWLNDYCKQQYMPPTISLTNNLQSLNNSECTKMKNRMETEGPKLSTIYH